nr:hypothetical protein [Tanacetum cinerariifolium]
PYGVVMVPQHSKMPLGVWIRRHLLTFLGMAEATRHVLRKFRKDSNMMSVNGSLTLVRHVFGFLDVMEWVYACVCELMLQCVHDCLGMPLEWLHHWDVD